MDNADFRTQRETQTRNMIAATAGTLFEERGAHNITYDDLARATKLSRTTLYKYFPSKSDILHYIALRAMTLLNEVMQKIIKQPIPADQQLRLICYELAHMFDEKPYYYKAMLENIEFSSEIRANNPLLDEIYIQGETLNDSFAQIIHSGMDQGVFRSDLDVKPTGVILLSFFTSLINLMRNKRQYIESEIMTINTFYDYGFTLILKTLEAE